MVITEMKTQFVVVILYVVHPAKIDNNERVPVFHMLPFIPFDAVVFETEYYFFKYLAYRVTDRNLPKFLNDVRLIIVITCFNI